MKPECTIWTGGTNGQGTYGIAAYKGRTTSAHRVAYCKHYNLDLEEIKGMDVCHTCDTPLCVNVEHLFLGTRKENMQDAVNKGRISRGESHSQALAARDFKYDEEHARRTKEAIPHGERHHNSKLCDEQVRVLRNLWDSGTYRQRQLAQMFGISQALVSLIVNNKVRNEN